MFATSQKKISIPLLEVLSIFLYPKMVYFSSLDEVYGKDFTRKYEDKLVSQQEFTKVHFDKDPLPLFLKERGYNQSQCFEVKAPQTNLPASQQPSSSRYQEMVKKSESDRLQKINHMNQMERPTSSNTPFDQLKNEGCSYYNAEEKLRRQMLLERIQFVEKELKKHKEKKIPTNSQQQSQEHFQSQYSPSPIPSNTTNQELFQLILMTAMGLLLIYIMDSIFEMGKKIGAKHK